MCSSGGFDYKLIGIDKTEHDEFIIEISPLNEFVIEITPVGDI